MLSNRITTRWFFAPGVAWAGVLISLLLVFHRQQGFCGGADAAGHLSPCDVVNSSRYSRVAGVPLSAIGLTAYSTIFVGFVAVIFLQPSPWRSRLVLGLRICVLFGASASAILVGLQAFEIRAFCPLCCGSAVCFFALALLTCLPTRTSNQESTPTHGWLVSGLTFGLPFLVTTGFLLTVLFTVKLTPSGTILATVDGQPITDNDLPTSLRLSIQPLEENAEKIRHEWVDQHLDELVLDHEAKRLGISSTVLLAQQTSTINISDAEITEWRNNHPDEGMVSNEDTSARIRLSRQSAAEDAYLGNR